MYKLLTNATRTNKFFIPQIRRYQTQAAPIIKPRRFRRTKRVLLYTAGAAAIGTLSVKGYYKLNLHLTKIGNSPIILYPISFLEGNYRVVKSFSTIASIYLEYKFYKTICEYLELSEEGTDKTLSKVHERGATRLLDTLVKLGGVFVKFGQELSLMKGALPIEYTNKLSLLQDRVHNGITLEVVRQIFLQEKKQTLEEIFSEFQEKPIAAASLAQVHRAKLLR